MLELFKGRKKTSPPKILVVDDESDILSVVAYRLQFVPSEVVTASSGREGLERAAAEQPDLILLDTNMPGMNGHEMLAHLRADPALRHIPVIMLTGRHEERDIAAASAHGVVDYVTKPFDFHQLVDRIQAALQPKAR